MRIWYFIERHLVATIVLIVVLGVAYKYNRELFFTGDYEITYTSKVMDRICELTTCMPGLKIDLVNTGHNENPEITLEVKNLSKPDGVTVDVAQEFFRPYAKKDPSPEPLDYVARRTGNGMRFVFKNVPSAWHISIKLSTDYHSGQKRNWDEPYIEISGRGSLLMENPYKVVIVQKVSDILNVFRARRDPTDAVEVISEQRR